jgi:hypothetical protein
MPGRVFGAPSRRGTMATSRKRETLTNASGKHYVRRREDGTIKKEVAVGKSASVDRRTRAKTTVRKGQGDRGDR